MQTKFQIPRVLRKYGDGQVEFELEGETVADLLAQVRQHYSALYGCICDETGNVRRHLHLFLNEELLALPQGLKTRVESGDVVSVFQAVSGG